MNCIDLTIWSLDLTTGPVLDWDGLDKEKDMIDQITEELDTYFGIAKYRLTLIEKTPGRPAMFHLRFNFRDAKDVLAIAEVKANMLTEPTTKYVDKVVATLVDDAFDALVEHWHFKSKSDMGLQQWLNMDSSQYDYWAKGGGKPRGWTFRRGTEESE